MSSTTSAFLRATQRAPRSCMSCSERKVKCDKAIPCSTCISRGTADTCVRETVLVRGEVKVAVDPPHLPTYDELSRENKRLRSELRVAQESLARDTPSGSRRCGRKSETHDVFEEMLFEQVASAMPAAAPPSKRLSWHSIILPSPRCSKQLVAYDRTWNSWAHYALEYPQFDQEHEAFWASLEQGTPLQNLDCPWLAVYFGVLCAAIMMMGDDEACKLHLPEHVNHKEICRNWYDAALFCLHESDFMRIANARSVQAISILGMCFNNFGDSELGNHLWSCALRIARKIGLDNPNSQQPLCLTVKGQRRLWWTLVICEWMAIPYHPPQIDEGDFDMSLPSLDPIPVHLDNENVQPVHYHIFMSRTSTVYYRFRKSLRDGLLPLDELVRRADEELAEIINTLPDYLQPEGNEAELIRELETTHPWIKWQRFDLTLVLLHHRLLINRVLQREWLSSPGRYDWARSVCIKSAIGVIWISQNWDQPAPTRKQWALSLHLFAAAILLLQESKNSKSRGPLEFQGEIETAIAQLDAVKCQSAVASRGVAILRDVLNDRHSLQS